MDKEELLKNAFVKWTHALLRQHFHEKQEDAPIIWADMPEDVQTRILNTVITLFTANFAIHFENNSKSDLADNRPEMPEQFLRSALATALSCELQPLGFRTEVIISAASQIAQNFGEDYAYTIQHVDHLYPSFGRVTSEAVIAHVIDNYLASTLVNEIDISVLRESITHAVQLFLIPEDTDESKILNEVYKNPEAFNRKLEIALNESMQTVDIGNADEALQKISANEVARIAIILSHNVAQSISGY